MVNPTTNNATIPRKPIPPNLGVADSPPKFRGGVSEPPCLQCFFEGHLQNSGVNGHPLNLGVWAYRLDFEKGLQHKPPKKIGNLSFKGNATSPSKLCSAETPGQHIAQQRQPSSRILIPPTSPGCSSPPPHPVELLVIVSHWLASPQRIPGDTISAKGFA